MSHVDTEAPVDNGSVIANPNVRRYLGVTLYIISLIAAVIALFLGFFPEFGGDVVNRALLFTNGLVSFLSGAFGIVVTLPNVPKR